jgi:hypothetical protein
LQALQRFSYELGSEAEHVDNLPLIKEALETLLALLSIATSELTMPVPHIKTTLFFFLLMTMYNVVGCYHRFAQSFVYPLSRTVQEA